MEKTKMNSKDIIDFNVFDLVCVSLLEDVAQCISESEFISIMPIALEGKAFRGSVAYEQLIYANKRDMLEYWQSVCSEMQLKIKYNTLKSLKIKYANSNESKWRPKLTEIEGLNECRTNTLVLKKQKLEEGLQDLQYDLKKTEDELAKQIQQFEEDIRLNLSKIRSILKNKIRRLDETITQRQQQVKLSNILLEE